jgi:hypothetical protein
MGEKIVPLEMNLVRYSNPVAVTEREEKSKNKVYYYLNLMGRK